MKRLILNYNDKCNLKCGHCYLTFQNQFGMDRSLTIIERAVDLNFSVITFGGGDPFFQSFFKQACTNAKRLGLFTHVDSNGLNIKFDDINFLLTSVDLLGLSLDGINDVHNRMRGKSNLFEHIEKLLDELQKRQYPVKINTVVTKQNYYNIIELASFLKKYHNISYWSLYQFFPLDAAKAKEHIYELKENLFQKLIMKITKNNYPFSIESLPLSKRINGYIFTDEQGRIYTNNISGEYIQIGNIFDSDIEVELKKRNLNINPFVKCRYR